MQDRDIERTKVVARVDEHLPVEVTRLAAEAGIISRVVFTPDVWALCRSQSEPDEFKAMAVRDQNAKRILLSLKRHFLSIKHKPVAFWATPAAHLVRLRARLRPDERFGEIEVYLDDL